MSNGQRTNPQEGRRPADPSARTERAYLIGLAALLFTAAALRSWNFPGNDFGNFYYAATVRSMAASWHNFFYAAFDPAGFLAVDKPPVAFWLQVLSVKLLGYSGLGLHLPQVIEGVLAVALVYHLTRRAAGPRAGLLAGLVMAVTPATVAIDRGNLPDSCLLLVLLVAARAVLQAAETARFGRLLLSAAMVGLAFNVKFTAACLVLPTFYLLYWLGAPLARSARLRHLGAATAVFLAVSLSWLLFVELTPPQSRPYVGGTQDNSLVSLAFGRQGLQRIAGGPMRPPQPPGPPGPGAPVGPDSDVLTGHGGRPGPLRLANRDMAGHITWLIPFAALGLVAAAAASGPRQPWSRLHSTLLLWSGWFGTYALVFSLSGTPIHSYYLTMLAPPIAALVGIGCECFCKEISRGPRWLLGALAAIGLTAAWQARVLDTHPPWKTVLLPIVLGAAGASAAGLLASQAWGRRPTTRRRAAGAAMALGLGALLVCPTAWALTPVLAPGGRMVPIADPVLLLRHPRTEDDADGAGRAPDGTTRTLIDFLRRKRGRERFLLAVPDIHPAAPIIIATGEPVMAYGGFSGSEPILAADAFGRMVSGGAVRFVLLSEQRPPGPATPGRPDPVAAWVR
ncbi:MAG: glycosyltransferase family 39 protein, partial [Planctomycetes bacterium]|nr:glycosyltransferase family 39 protein [Planctomycetota bacterium]